MGAKFKKYFEIVEEKGGVPAKMRFAMKTGVASNKAESADETPESLDKFHKIAVELVGDFPKV